MDIGAGEQKGSCTGLQANRAGRKAGGMQTWVLSRHPRTLRRHRKEDAHLASPWTSGSSCPRPLWDCCNLAFEHEGISTPHAPTRLSFSGLSLVWAIGGAEHRRCEGAKFRAKAGARHTQGEGRRGGSLGTGTEEHITTG